MYILIHPRRNERLKGKSPVARCKPRYLAFECVILDILVEGRVLTSVGCRCCNASKL